MRVHRPAQLAAKKLRHQSRFSRSAGEALPLGRL